MPFEMVNKIVTKPELIYHTCEVCQNLSDSRWCYCLVCGTRFSKEITQATPIEKTKYLVPYYFKQHEEFNEPPEILQQKLETKIQKDLQIVYGTRWIFLISTVLFLILGIIFLALYRHILPNKIPILAGCFGASYFSFVILFDYAIYINEKEKVKTRGYALALEKQKTRKIHPVIKYSFLTIVFLIGIVIACPFYFCFWYLKGLAHVD